jgi:hypothetical protein
MQRVRRQTFFDSAEIEIGLDAWSKRPKRGHRRLHCANDTILAKLFGRKSAKKDL